MITILIELAWLDGEYSLKEKKLILKIVHYLQIDYEEYKTILALYLPKEDYSQKKEETSSFQVLQGELTLEECYEVLKTSKHTDNATLKKNYRNMAKEYHADILQGKELPDELISFAQEKLKIINFSYSKLKNHRNF
jgi:DnaJ-domain-containing protein 1